MTRTDRMTILADAIGKNPGIQFSDLLRLTGMKNGVLSHYLRKLEKSDTVWAYRRPRQTSYYPPEITESDSRIIRSLRRSTPRKIICSLLAQKDGLEFREIVGRAMRSPSTVSLYLSQVVKDGTVEIFYHENQKKYRIRDRASVDGLIERYYPRMLDRPVSGFEDIINSL